MAFSSPTSRTCHKPVTTPSQTRSDRIGAQNAIPLLLKAAAAESRLKARERWVVSTLSEGREREELVTTDNVYNNCTMSQTPPDLRSRPFRTRRTFAGPTGSSRLRVARGHPCPLGLVPRNRSTLPPSPPIPSAEALLDLARRSQDAPNRKEGRMVTDAHERASEADSRPPLICPRCIESQVHHPWDLGRSVWYCPHSHGGTLAVQVGPHWRITTGVPQERMEGINQRGEALVRGIAIGLRTAAQAEESAPREEPPCTNPDAGI
jgi:hypothetical protein